MMENRKKKEIKYVCTLRKNTVPGTTNFFTLFLVDVTYYSIRVYVVAVQHIDVSPYGSTGGGFMFKMSSWSTR